ncbi:hypothetical protein CW304_15025 [Bacillus sp. UFRGS-B20]|nr:hypothetical protein CW304_15025 [Bacillus sp. UFRGS-B20]
MGRGKEVCDMYTNIKLAVKPLLIFVSKFWCENVSYLLGMVAIQKEVEMGWKSEKTESWSSIYIDESLKY